MPLIPVLGILAVGTFWWVLPAEHGTPVVEGILALALAVILATRSLRNPPILLVMLFVLSTVYSVVIPFYVFPDRFVFPIQSALSDVHLIIAIRLLAMLLFALWDVPGFIVPQLEWSQRGSWAVFIGALSILIYISIFEVTRGDFGTGYSVRVSPLYEYSYLFVIVAAASSRNYVNRVVSLLIVGSVIIMQDAYYGGRVTSVQVGLALALTLFAQHLTLRRVSVLAVCGGLLSLLVGTVRSVGSGDLSVFKLFTSDHLFVSSTAQYSYYASLTHIAAAQSASDQVKSASFQEFLLQIFKGGQGSLTSMVSKDYFVNVGGGIYPTHFYFWGGVVGAAVACIFLSIMLRQLVHGGWVRGSLFVTLLVASPRWLLYNPTAAYRSLLIMAFMAVAVVAWKHMAPKPNSGLSELNSINY